GPIIPNRPEIAGDAAEGRVRADAIFEGIRRNHPAGVVIVERPELADPVEPAVQRGTASSQSLHDSHRGAREDDQQTTGPGDPPLPDRVQFRRDLGQPALVSREVLELVEHDDQVPLRRELEQRAKDRAPGGVILGPEIFAGPAGGFFDEGAAIDLRGGGGGREVERAVSIPQVRQEIGLADPASAVEERELAFPRIGERTQLRRLGLTIDQALVRHSAASRSYTYAQVYKYVYMLSCWYITRKGRLKGRTSARSLSHRAEEGYDLHWMSDRRLPIWIDPIPRS